jgi:diaminopimelate decarboxylase
MNYKDIPFEKEVIENIISEFGSPVYVYDEKGIKETVERINSAFSWAKCYKNYFAVKATPTPKILELLHEAGMGFDCSSFTELKMAEKLRIKNNDLFFTSNNTTKKDYELAIELGAIINIDDITQVPVFVEALEGRSYKSVALRYNPGNLHSGNVIIGNPVEAKFGMSLEQLIEGYKILTEQNIDELGLHAMIASNELDTDYFATTAKIMKNAVKEIERKISRKISFINIGGGFGVNYSPKDKEFDIELASKKIRNELKENGLTVLTENGRYVTGPNGYLITKVNYVMDKHKSYIGVDASMHNLMRPGMYGAYHHISILGKEGTHKTYDVVGSLCENNDKFAVDRQLPEVVPGDIAIIHDAGAHGHSMGFNYNGSLRSAEVLLKEDGSFKLIRRAETVEDYFRTIVW